MTDFTNRIFKQYKIRSVLDVGANVGGFVHTWLAHGAEIVHAVEPEPGSFGKLAATFAGDPRVVVHQLGVSDAPGVIEKANVFNCHTLRPDKTATIPHGNSQHLDRALEFTKTPAFDVELITIDQLCATVGLIPDFIKIDVDGYDAKALRGATRIITSRRPVIMFEVSYLPFFVGDCCECMIRSIFEMGYTITSIVPDADYPRGGRRFTDARQFMRGYPWDTSFDVILEPA